MSLARTIEEVTQKLAGTYLKDRRWSSAATVLSYDASTLTCEVQTIGDDASIIIPGVLLIADVEDGLVKFPSIGSTVYIAQSNRNSIYVEMFSKLDSVQLTIPNGSGGWTQLLISGRGIQMNDGSFGGMVKLIDPNNASAGVLARLNAIETFINTLQTAINAWTPVPNDGGAALKVALASWLASTVPTSTRAELENTIITQGK